MRYFIICLLWMLLASPAYAMLNIDITRGNTDPMPIAVTDLIGTSPQDQQLGRDVAQVITADLERSGLFRVIDKHAFIENISSSTQLPQFASWRQINADALTVGSVKLVGNKITAEFRLWDVLAQEQIAGKAFTTEAQNWRRVAHMIADVIYQRLTGEAGYFDTRIVYIAESGPQKHRVKRLAIMDQDGANHQFLTDGSELVLTPRFSPTMQQVIYMAYRGGSPRVYLRDLTRGTDRLLGKFSGMSFAPRFSPSGKYAILSASLDGNSELFELELASGKIRRITYDPAIDTSPSYSADESRIVFNSDRGGSQQLYVMNRDGTGVQRISFGNGKYGTPVWSPRGDLIAFTKIHSGKFHIGVMRPDGSGERLLTSSYLDEGPTWSPNGRVIMFTREEPGGWGNESRTRIYSIDLTGYNEIEIPTPLDASDPAWSPLR
jgi:TolB protein